MRRKVSRCTRRLPRRLPINPLITTAPTHQTNAAGKLSTLARLPASPEAEFSKMKAAETPPLSRVWDQPVKSSMGLAKSRRRSRGGARRTDRPLLGRFPARISTQPSRWQTHHKVGSPGTKFPDTSPRRSPAVIGVWAAHAMFQERVFDAVRTRAKRPGPDIQRDHRNGLGRLAGGQWRAMRHGVAGTHGNGVIVESVTYRV